MGLRALTGHPALVPAIFIACAIVLGGGGSPNPLSELMLQLCAAVALVAWLFLPSGTRTPAGPTGIDRRIWWIAAACLALPLLQLVPLPPTLWQALPGRGVERDALGLVGAADTWRPLSLLPERTLASLLALGPPLLAMAMTASLPARARPAILVTVATMALASAALGALQLAGGDDAFRLYPYSHRGWLTGFQANRNAEADVLLIGLAALAAIAALPRTPSSSPRSLVRAGYSRWLWPAAGLLTVATVLTGSRTGIALMVLLSLGLALLHRSGAAALRGRLTAVLAVAALLFAGAVAALVANPVLRRVAGRFALSGDYRGELWTDTLYAIGQFWPAGAGMGTFTPVLMAAERLEVVDPTIPNRAHNDYLELILEAGLPGIAVALVIAVLVATLARGAWRRGTERATLTFALPTIAVIALHSVVDYPLRSMALACLAGVAAGMLARPPGAGGKQAS